MQYCFEQLEPIGAGELFNAVDFDPRCTSNIYRLLADAWSVYDNSGGSPHLLEQGP